MEKYLKLINLLSDEGILENRELVIRCVNCSFEIVLRQNSHSVPDAMRLAIVAQKCGYSISMYDSTLSDAEFFNIEFKRSED